MLSTPTRETNETRTSLLAEIIDAGRENSTAGVLFQNVVATRMGITITDLKVLDMLTRLGPLTPGEIGGRTGLATASVTGLVDRLEDKGFVRRVRDTEDRRKVRVKPDWDGLKDASRWFQAFGESLASMLEENYSDDQLEVILDFLRRSTQCLREAADNLPEQTGPFG